MQDFEQLAVALKLFQARGAAALPAPPPCTPMPKPEIGVPVPQKSFVGQTNCTNVTMAFSLQWTKWI